MGTIFMGFHHGPEMQIFGVSDERLNIVCHKNFYFFRMGQTPIRDFVCVFVGSEKSGRQLLP